MKRCLSCRLLGNWDRSGRCPDCRRTKNSERERNPLRRAVKAERYDRAYRAMRGAIAREIAVYGYVCARGGERHAPGSPFDLDHLPSGALAASCPTHNRSARSNPA